MSFQTNESVSFSNIAATTAAFLLQGGLYGVTATATWGGGSATLQRLSGDGSTYITVLTAFADDGYATVSLPPGTYIWTIDTSTAVYLDIVAIAQGT